MSRIHTVQAIVGRHYKVTMREMNGQCRQRHIAHPRQVAMAIVRDVAPDLSYPQISAMFGGRHHTTVMYAVKMVERRQMADAEMHADFMALSNQARDAIGGAA
jgi:chromosomal replication initiator protein